MLKGDQHRQSNRQLEIIIIIKTAITVVISNDT